ncbi:uncharacterized protein LOC143286940 [Babylonia areolata]|uniref:uncharacterized protein LOC143286940 n=1 Tax=Babylonia areolata TaxID=304850 RepID=UPI003FCF9BFE
MGVSPAAVVVAHHCPLIRSRGALLLLMMMLMVLMTLVNEGFAKYIPEDPVPAAGVSIEDFIDLDAPPSPSVPKEGAVLTSQPGSDAAGKVETTVGHGNFRIVPGLGPAPPPIPVIRGDVIKPIIRHTPMTSDDEDVELSGDGSGSGDGLEAAETEIVTAQNVTATTSRSADQGSKVNLTTVDTPQDLVIGEGGDTVTFKVGDPVTSEDNYTISDVIYTADVWPPVPVKEQTDEGDDIELWSPWIRTNDVTEVRVRTCTGTAESCNGTDAEIRHCDRESNRCDVKEAMVTSESDTAIEEKVECPTNSEENEDPDQVIQPVQKPRPLPPGEIDLQRTELEPCTYSLFDVKRGKYLVTQWSLTRLVTQAKVKKWCAKPQEYLVFHSPHAHCRRYYKDLCHVSMRCKGSRTPPKARGDFAEGCWRQFVYGGQLPVGLSNRQTIVYLICQRFAAMSTLGKTFGHKRAHFATLYDTKGRAPVVSLVRLSEIGDEAWPHTPYFIEHGLVEDTEDTAWFLRKAKKGMVRLEDMGKCQDEDSCQLGAHQVLPSDYSATTYRTAHLIWPELAGPDPLSRTATFTLTNTAPMHASLYPAWHRAVLHVRRFAVQQCGVPQVSPAEFVSSKYHHSSSRKSPSSYHYFWGGQEEEDPAIYIASGVIPSRDPMETIGNDINVPFMFWMAACCVARNTTTTANNNNHRQHRYHNHHQNQHHYPHHNDYADLFRSGSGPRKAGGGRQQHSSFAIYARNAGPGSVERGGEGEEGRGQVVAAPVLQLELLLQDIYKTLPTDPDVNLFPAARGACSELRNDFSRHVHL